MNHRERHARLFNRIAIPYSWFFAGQTRSYARCFDIGRTALPSPQGKRALDIGCGTGAFTSALRAEGWDVEGIDVAQEMIAHAAKSGLRCSVVDILGAHGIADTSFDLVSAAYVAHGLPLEDRCILYRECKRISKDTVLFHDYSENKRLLTSIVEYLEGGDYFNFIRTVRQELAGNFSDVKVLRVGPQSAWYICKP
jgi:2-polyprenyl-3-methyl-5-hydroxy-6-metoxy-1,4-benzoquinol methylase